MDRLRTVRNCLHDISTFMMLKHNNIMESKGKYSGSKTVTMKYPGSNIVNNILCHMVRNNSYFLNLKYFYKYINSILLIGYSILYYTENIVYLCWR